MSRALILADDWDHVPELLTAARAAGLSEAIVLSDEKPASIDTAAAYGAKQVALLSLPSSPAGIARVLVEAAKRLRPLVVMAAATKDGREAVSRAAQRLGSPCANDCSSMELVEGGLRITRPVLGGVYVAAQELRGEPVFLSLQLKRREPSPAESPSKPEVVRLEMDIPEEGVKILEVKPAERSGVDLEAAEVIVSVGRGFKKKEDLSLASELAALIGGEVGCSRPIAGDLKWLPEDRHIGLSGKWVKPRLYLAVGISGQIQHLVGIRGSKTIVAVNNDPSAPIHREADYSVVADLYEFLPALIERLRSIRAR